MVDYAISHGLTPFVSMQNNYSLVYREEEREMFPTLKVQSSRSSASSLLLIGVCRHTTDVRRGCNSVLAARPLASRPSAGDADRT